ncbi:unnamed protein product [Prorocentrum cordatum]|uniref:Uncharacterized protein n=1 Tax=Prorocentrum cordatum TaxID=2364126 RepID=A0ABN9RAQ5_9DINO|nr:unnamed protein product [Polarella glacialis]
MAVHINAAKISDGTGRDTYIDRVDEVQRGREMLVTMSPTRMFKHWDLRSPSPPRSSPNGLTMADMMRTKRPCSHSRGGRGWQPSLNLDDCRRTQQSLAYSMRSSSRASSVGGSRRRSPLDVAMQESASLSGSLRSTQSPKSGWPQSPLATAIRAGRRADRSSPRSGGTTSIASASRTLSMFHTHSGAWRPASCA